MQFGDRASAGPAAASQTAPPGPPSQGALVQEMQEIRRCITWTRKILDALTHCAYFMDTLCDKDNFGPGKRAIGHLRRDVIEPAQGQCQKASDDATRARLKLEGERLKNCMDVEELKRALRESMVGLRVVQRIHQGKGSMSSFWQYVATVNMAWQLVLPGTFGRSGELANLTELEVLNARRDGHSFVTIFNRKTNKKYGEVGRHLEEFTWKAVDCYLSLPPLEGASWTDETRPFLRPSKPHMQRVDMYKLLETGGRVHCPGKTFPRTNLPRKQKTGTVDKDAETCRAWIAAFNLHTEKTAKKHYRINLPEEQAAKGMAMVRAFLGQELKWPSDDELPQETIEQAETRLRAKYGRRKSTGGDANLESDTKSDGDSDGFERPAAGAKPRAARARARKAFGQPTKNRAAGRGQQGAARRRPDAAKAAGA